ncbi:ATP-binding protein [Nonomuraea sp. NPDC050536]|uniref:ATP-binding protein n=1 Tax=Nonomuraea sp. NPDC050536 TaxID=3364366 RepID=UPI0037CA6424
MRLTPSNRLVALADGLYSEIGDDDDDRTASWVLASGPTAVAMAQRITRTRLALWGLHDYVSAAELLVTELVTNALRHGDRIRLMLTAEDGLLRCEVEHAEPIRLRLSVGREQLLLAGLACCWGTARTPEGKIVWFELPTPAPA